jgi:hypothetical protein
VSDRLLTADEVARCCRCGFRGCVSRRGRVPIPCVERRPLSALSRGGCAGVARVVFAAWPAGGVARSDAVTCRVVWARPRPLPPRAADPRRRSCWTIVVEDAAASSSGRAHRSYNGSERFSVAGAGVSLAQFGQRTAAVIRTVRCTAAGEVEPPARAGRTAGSRCRPADLRRRPDLPRCSRTILCRSRSGICILRTSAPLRSIPERRRRHMTHTRYLQRSGPRRTVACALARTHFSRAVRSAMPPAELALCSGASCVRRLHA